MREQRRLRSMLTAGSVSLPRMLPWLWCACLICVGCIPAAPAEAQGTRHRVEGVLSNSNGEPLAGQRIVLVGVEDSLRQGGVGTSAPDGRFAVEVPGGAYHVRTATRLGNQCTVSGYDNPDSGWQAIVEVRGEHVTGILVTVAGEPSAVPTLVSCAFPLEELGQIRGTVTDAQDEPVPGFWSPAGRYATPVAHRSRRWMTATGGNRRRLHSTAAGAYNCMCARAAASRAAFRPSDPAARGRASR